MRPGRRILRSAAFRSTAAATAVAWMRLVQRTTRWTRSGDEVIDALLREGRPVILCYWHGRLFMLGPGWRHRARTRLLVSAHADGRLIAAAMERLGFRTIAGSTSRGGSDAVREMARALAAGDMVGMTPDGPRGPRMRASPGAIALARLTGAVLVPVACAVTRRRVVPSWDRLVVPLPFGRGVYMIGAPMPVDRHAGPAAREAARRELERRLNALTDEADRRCGQPAITPAAAPVHA